MSYFVARILFHATAKGNLTRTFCKNICKSSFSTLPRNLYVNYSHKYLPRRVLSNHNIPNNMFVLCNLHSQVNKDNSNIKENEPSTEKEGFWGNLIRSKVLTIPNILTTTRILLTPVLGYLVIQESYTAALSIFVFAGFTDLFDGLIARNFESQTSPLGSFLDPLADKLLVSTLFATLTYADLIPVYLMVLVILRDALLMSAGMYVRYITLVPRPTSLKEYFDPTNHAVKLQPTLSSKFNTAVQLLLVAATLASPVFGFTDHQLLHALGYLTAVTTVSSGIGYLFAKDTIKHASKIYKKTK